MRGLSVALPLLSAAVVSADPASVTITRRAGTADLSEREPALSCRGAVISTGSYLTVFKPGCKGAVGAAGEARQAGENELKISATAPCQAADQGWQGAECLALTP